MVKNLPDQAGTRSAICNDVPSFSDMMLHRYGRLTKVAQCYLACLAVLLAFGPPVMAADNRLHNCGDDELDASKRIVVCTSLLEDKAVSVNDQALAHFNRANALDGSGE
ncbi:hypothetical protein, partial [Mesorhizobium sp. M7A.F.Ca.CA.002.05.1.1]